MAAYVVLFRESPIRDPEEMAQYHQKGTKNPEQFGLRPLVVYGEQTPLEGDAPDGVIVLEFPDVERAKAWYYSEGYQDAVKHRLKAADYRGVIVDGFAMPAAG